MQINVSKRRFGWPVVSLHLALPAAFLLLRWATPSGTVRTLRDAGTATVTELVVAAVAVLAWAALGWLAAVATCAAVATTSGRLGALGEAALRCLAPVAVRQVLAVALSAGVVAGPALPAAATSHGRPGPSAPATLSLDALDRPVDPGAVEPAVATAPTAWTPDRPVRPVRRERPTDVRLVTCWPERPLVEDDVVVRRGDSLWDVAERALGPGAGDAEVAEAWPRWYAANRAVIGADPSTLHPGQRLRPPARDAACTSVATGRVVPAQHSREDHP